ncbi:UNVERIFIED_CONTAM: hypothetical protein BJ099_11444 [Lysinibacillus xylanilyticus]
MAMRLKTIKIEGSFSTPKEKGVYIYRISGREAKLL